MAGPAAVRLHHGKARSPPHQLWWFTYLAVRRVLLLAPLVLRTSGSKEIEILSLRHELEILGRNQPWPLLERGEGSMPGA